MFGSGLETKKAGSLFSDGPSNELLSMIGVMYETRTYNSMLQLTQVYSSASSGVTYVSYNYPSTQNNGKISSQTDNVSGEQVVYTYDALNRLATAVATSNAWGQSYSYDGFGNLTDETVIAGSAPAYHVTPDPTTNHLGSVDLNGNTLAVMYGGYDVENRFTGTLSPGFTPPGSYQYSYAPGNKRVWRGVIDSSGTTLATDEVTFWSVTGQKLASYNIVLPGGNGPGTPPSIVFQLNVANYYFGAKMVGHYSSAYGLTATSSDRLGSVGKYYPYGQEKPSATTNGTEKFTGYFRDSETGFDYANERFHNPGTGRFLTPDPYRGSARKTDPRTWNRYAYTNGDPVNFKDPTGLGDDGFVPICDPNFPDDPGCDGDPGDGPGGPSPEDPVTCPNGTHDDGQGRCIANPPSCEDLETAYVAAYLTAQGSPLAAYASLIVQDSDAEGLDDRFIVALAGVESSYGKNLNSNRGPFNAFNYGFKGFAGFGNAIETVINALTTDPLYTPYQSTKDVYSVYEEGNVNKASPQQDTLDTIYGSQLGGNLSNIRDPRCP